ncbi:MAG: hypothetical protein KDA44_05125 [Planctomycetales bacterium]|nr:hypothetical protein [Planctomycetales bacterium]
MDLRFSCGGAARRRGKRTTRRAASLVTCGLATYLAATSARCLHAAETPVAAAAEQLVQAALESELSGDNASRDAYLSEARQISESPQANWQSGLVEFEGRWLSPEDVARAAADDPARQEYKRLRDASTGTLDDHRYLADWCRKNGLAVQERFHRKAILQQDPGDVESLRRLGLRPFRNVFATDEEIEQIVAEEQQRATDLKRYGREFKKWLGEALRTDEEGRAAVLDRFRSVTDPGALEALELASIEQGNYLRRLQRRMGVEAGAEYWNDLRVSMLQAAANMEELDATLLLARTAVFSSEPTLRDAASLALRDRRPTDYIPQLMSQLRSLIEADVDVSITPTGDVTYSAVFREEGVDVDREHVDSFAAVTIVDGTPGQAERAALAMRTATQYNRAQGMAIAATNEVAAINAERYEVNAQVIEALKAITGEDWGDDPAAWRAQWSDYNDMYYPETKEVVDTQSQAVDYQYVYIPSASEPTQAPPPARHECFAIGTLVWTQTGPERIETLVPGDLVLAQNPLDGELAYKPVMMTTVRPPTKFMELNFADGDRLWATRGHRFWVAGEGWRMARFLKADTPLHALSGAQSLASVREFEGEEAYNLIVDEFHTYFVGQTKALVHDCTCPASTLAPIPGMDARRGPVSLADGYGALGSTP